MKWKKLVIFSSILLSGTFFLLGALQQEQKAMADKLIRLHVVAHSDEKEDQAEKLKVRDAVIAVTEPLSSQEDFAAALPEIQKAAEDCLQDLGSTHGVTVSLGKERFPTRYYDTFALPAGVYPSLRVTIGEGAGKNWWCVAFPSICFRATAEELEQVATTAGFSQEEVKLIREDGNHYVLKFKVLELLGELKAQFFDS